jgi:hypothetical protein
MENLILLAKCAALFVLGAFCFDIVHYILHVFENSRFSFLRRLGGLHGVHHLFLDLEMKIQRQHSRANLILHVIPEYMTAVIGMAILGFLFFGWLPALIVIALRTVMVIVYCFQKGEDYTHAEMRRIDANRSLFFVGPRYHALHHVYVNQYYSSFVNIFDLLFGTNCQIRGRHFLVTGASGAYGSVMVDELRKRGGVVETASSGVEFSAADVSGLTGKLKRADVVVLAHGAKGAAAWDANYVTCVKIIDLFRELGRERLVPPEVWGMGSEIEIHPHFGAKDIVEYSNSKRAFARNARFYYSSPDVIYRHIVASAFTSQMGRGLISAKTAVKMSLFFITRGFTYVPVTYTTLAFWNYFKFLSLPKLDKLRSSH